MNGSATVVSAALAVSTVHASGSPVAVQTPAWTL